MRDRSPIAPALRYLNMASGRARSAMIWLLISALMISGCASTSAPVGWLPTVTQAPDDAYGAWISAESTKDDHPYWVGGELIAVTSDSVFILTGNQLTGLSQASIKNAEITFYQPEPRGPLSSWTLVGALSTLSHGYFLVFTAPMWIIVGASSAGSVSRASIVRYPRRKWPELGNYARFPRGFPVGLDRGVLKSK